MVSDMKNKLIEELQDLPNNTTDLDPMELTAALAAAQGAKMTNSNSATSGQSMYSADSRNSTPLPVENECEMLTDDLENSSEQGGTETPLDPGWCL